MAAVPAIAGAAAMFAYPENPVLRQEVCLKTVLTERERIEWSTPGYTGIFGYIAYLKYLIE